MRTLASSVPAQQEQARDLPEALPCNEQGHNQMNWETYTIIQRNSHDIWGVIGVVHNYKLACDLAADYCNMNGVARTLVLNSMGQCVCVES